MRSSVLCLLLVLLPVATGFWGIGRTQSVAVTGTLQCNGKPAANVKVKLYDREILFDKKLDQGKSDANGYFKLSGSKREISNIDPKLNIYHKCNYAGLCYKKLAIKIPSNFITRGANPSKTFDIGTLNLANKVVGEKIDCIN
ncbi:unnamed protein product [Nippostrongylus brasiliensis]|uniref:Transthyretin-like family protein n=1 Tax=Nippostrongylus brasiliensis TaxID=27835 RepID=A0A0N4Y2M7_NIPBR|nr:unnamed protein product [Nippostrongylus brasiliensis]